MPRTQPDIAELDRIHWPFSWLSSFFFGCFHGRTTFPITLKGRTYVACLNCGKEIPYSWSAMKVGTSDQLRHEA